MTKNESTLKIRVMDTTILLWHRDLHDTLCIFLNVQHADSLVAVPETVEMVTLTGSVLGDAP